VGRGLSARKTGALKKREIGWARITRPESGREAPSLGFKKNFHRYRSVRRGEKGARKNE